VKNGFLHDTFLLIWYSFARSDSQNCNYKYKGYDHFCSFDVYCQDKLPSPQKKKNLRTLFQPPEYRRPVTVATPADVGIPTFEQAWLIDRIQQNEN
jgi:hypothetical protein